MPREPIEIGTTFGRWTVIGEPVPREKIKIDYYSPVRCECGSESLVPESGLKSGTSNSCGCLQREKASERFKDHGMSGDPIHGLWMKMIERCHKPDSEYWKNYGSRGIAVCERWHVFENFYADMGDRPLGLSLDRIDVNGPYSPENCRWATPKEQARNMRKNVFVDVRGERVYLVDAFKLVPVTNGAFYSWKKKRKATHQETIDHFLKKIGK